MSATAEAAAAATGVERTNLTPVNKAVVRSERIDSSVRHSEAAGPPIASLTPDSAGRPAGRTDGNSRQPVGPCPNRARVPERTGRAAVHYCIAQ